MLCCALLSLLTTSAPEVKTYTVGGVSRIATVFAPSRPGAHPPLVFGFHGHGGNMRNAANSFQMHEVWPEAVVVYMQGLPTAGMTDPEGKKNGWQQKPSDENGRDVAFFDAVYADVTKRFAVDLDRVYSMGHSNGGRFTYVLWSERGELFAAFAPSGSPGALLASTPKPLFHIAGQKDPIVNFTGQRLTVDAVKRKNGCQGQGEKVGTYATMFKGKDGNDVVAYFHPGGHEYPRAEGPKLIAEFFKTHRRH
ncbi:MAG: esterase [Armatimonadetes bacterium]|nr:esterase [Armatimonadota bacterium]